MRILTIDGTIPLKKILGSIQNQPPGFYKRLTLTSGETSDETIEKISQALSRPDLGPECLDFIEFTAVSDNALKSLGNLLEINNGIKKLCLNRARSRQFSENVLTDFSDSLTRSAPIELQLKASIFSIEYLNKLMVTMPHLSRVSLEANNLGYSSDCTFLLQTLAQRKLTYLNLASNALGGSHMPYIAQILLHDSLDEFNLNYNNLGEAEFDQFSNSLAKATALKTLSLNENNLGRKSKSLLEAVAENQSLINLYLNGNYLSSFIDPFIKKILLNHKRLEVISLRKNNILDEKIDSMFSGVNTNSGRLMKLNLSNNQLTDKGAASILGFLQRNLCFFSPLCLKDNKISTQNILLIDEKIKENKYSYFLTKLLILLIGLTDQNSYFYKFSFDILKLIIVQIFVPFIFDVREYLKLSRC